MKRATVIILGIFLVVTGSLMIFRDAFGESIQNTAEAVALNLVSSKINDSLEG